MSGLFVLALLSCARRDLPGALQLDEPAEVRPTITALPHDLASAATILVGEDPLLRRPDFGRLGQWAALPGGEPIEAWATLARQPDVSPQAWAELETRNRGTLAVPLARGSALAVVEVLAATLPRPGDPRGDDASLALLSWLSRLSVDSRPRPPDARLPFSWLGLSDEPVAQSLVVIGERRVLLGWLDGPQIPVAAAAAALDPAIYHRLASEPAGLLLLARAAKASDAEARARGLADLQRATNLALLDAAADRDQEQHENAERLSAESAALSAEDPIATLLGRAWVALSKDAGRDDSAGLALVALNAERLMASCPGGSCRDLDRTTGIAAAARWGDEPLPLVRLWQLIAVKRAVDSFEVTAERPSFADTLPDLADALLGTTGGPLTANALHRGMAAPQLLLELSRAADGSDELDIDGTAHALHLWLARTCDAAMATPQSPENVAIIQRIRARAAP